MKANIKKPKWLEQLEKESWQAELLISGIALFAASQLPKLVERLIDFVLVNIPPTDAALFYGLFVLLYFGVYLLVGGLILHFLLRAFWVGLIGFNSVFGGEINTENDAYYSKVFLRKVATSLPLDSNIIIRNLDHFCSVIFAVIGIFVMAMMAFVIDVGIVYGLKLFLSHFFGNQVLSYIYIAIIVIFYTFIFLLIIFNSKRLKESEKAQIWYYRIFINFNKLFLHIFYKPIQYISFSIITNIDYKRYMLYILGVSLTSGFFTGIMLANTNLSHLAIAAFKDEPYLDSYYRPDKMIPEHYANLRNENDVIVLSAIIENNNIEAEQFEVFIPVFDSETYLYSNCIEEMNNAIVDNLSPLEKKQVKRENRLECIQQYHHFTINENVIEPLDIIAMDHPNNNEYGILIHLSTADLEKGQNVLYIEKRHLETDDIFRRIAIPFQVVE